MTVRGLKLSPQLGTPTVWCLHTRILCIEVPLMPCWYKIREVFFLSHTTWREVYVSIKTKLQTVLLFTWAYGNLYLIRQTAYGSAPLFRIPHVLTFCRLFSILGCLCTGVCNSRYTAPFLPSPARLHELRFGCWIPSFFNRILVHWTTYGPPPPPTVQHMGPPHLPSIPYVLMFYGLFVYRGL